MELNKHFEVYLNYLTPMEFIFNRDQPEVYVKEYENYVFAMLQANPENRLFVEDILIKYKRYSDQPIEEIFDENPGIRKIREVAPNPHQDGNDGIVFYDTMMDLFIEPHHLFYDRFFATLLKHKDLLQLDQCLSYQLEKHYSNNLASFSRFLHLVIRKFNGKILSEKTVLTIQEWIHANEQQQKAEQEGLNNKDPYKGKKNGRIKRRADDNVTALNHEQTILFIQYMKEAGIFLRDEYLTDADAGKAFELLTGYSLNTIRQDLGKYYNYQNKENIKRLQLVFTRLINQMNNKLREVHPRS